MDVAIRQVKERACEHAPEGVIYWRKKLATLAVPVVNNENMFFGIFTDSGLRQLRQSIAKKDTGADEWWRLRYQVAIGDIAFFKSQQWKVANYGLLLDAALVGIAFKLIGNTDLERRVLVVLVWFTYLAAAYVLWDLNEAIKRARCRLKEALAKFKKESVSKRNLVFWLLQGFLFVAAVTSSCIILHPASF